MKPIAIIMNAFLRICMMVTMIIANPIVLIAAIAGAIFLWMNYGNEISGFWYHVTGLMNEMMATCQNVIRTIINIIPSGFTG